MGYPKCRAESSRLDTVLQIMSMRSMHDGFVTIPFVSFLAETCKIEAIIFQNASVFIFRLAGHFLSSAELGNANRLAV
jgi:hypothetical protein